MQNKTKCLAAVSMAPVLARSWRSSRPHVTNTLLNPLPRCLSVALMTEQQPVVESLCIFTVQGDGTGRTGFIKSRHCQAPGHLWWQHCMSGTMLLQWSLTNIEACSVLDKQHQINQMSYQVLQYKLHMNACSSSLRNA